MEVFSHNTIFLQSTANKLILRNHNTSIPIKFTYWDREEQRKSFMKSFARGRYEIEMASDIRHPEKSIILQARNYTVGPWYVYPTIAPVDYDTNTRICIIQTRSNTYENTSTPMIYYHGLNFDDMAQDDSSYPREE